MASGFLFIDGRDPDSVFSSGNAGITTGLLHASSGADLGSLYISGNSGITTGLLSETGADIGSLFGIGGPLSNPGYGNMEGIASQSHGSGNATAQVSVIIEGNGTWVDTAVSGQPSSGNWYAPTTANIGNGYYVTVVFVATGGSLGSLAFTNISTPTLIGTSSQTATASLTYGAGGVSTASHTGTCQVIISTDAAQSHVVSNQTVTWHLEVQIV